MILHLAEVEKLVYEARDLFVTQASAEETSDLWSEDCNVPHVNT